MTADERHEEYLRYSFKELLAEVATKIDRLAAAQDGTRGDFERRISAMERGVPLGQDLVRRFLAVEQGVPALDRRLSVLEAEAGAQRLDLEAQAANRRWLVGLSVTTFLGMVGTATAVVTLLLHLRLP